MGYGRKYYRRMTCLNKTSMQDCSVLNQGGHTLWEIGKTGKMVKKNSLQGKIKEFEILLKIREKSGNLKESSLC